MGHPDEKVPPVIPTTIEEVIATYVAPFEEAPSLSSLSSSNQLEESNEHAHPDTDCISSCSWDDDDTNQSMNELILQHKCEQDLDGWSFLEDESLVARRCLQGETTKLLPPSISSSPSMFPFIITQSLPQSILQKFTQPWM